mgnify:CR=1 FL=1
MRISVIIVPLQLFIGLFLHPHKNFVLQCKTEIDLLIIISPALKKTQLTWLGGSDFLWEKILNCGLKKCYKVRGIKGFDQEKQISGLSFCSLSNSGANLENFHRHVSISKTVKHSYDHYSYIEDLFVIPHPHGVGKVANIWSGKVALLIPKVQNGRYSI